MKENEKKTLLDVSRRDFVRTSIAGMTGLAVMNGLSDAFAQTATALQNEDGYKLWLR